MPDLDLALVEKAAQKLTDEGAAPGSSIHSWRCEYPERYGSCDCVDEVARIVLSAVYDDIAAQAWDEGYGRGAVMAHLYGHTDNWPEEDSPHNPYRADALDGGYAPHIPGYATGGNLP